jgi:Lipoprotein confined to pathogenic Mycobacterium
MSIRILRSIAATLAASSLLLGACDRAPNQADGAPAMEISKLPTINETQAQMLDLINRVQAQVAGAVPETRPWRWMDRWSSNGCGGGGPSPDGVMLLFPNLLSEHGLTDSEWARVFPDIRHLAAGAGLTDLQMFQNSSRNYDARFGSPDGRLLIFGSRNTTLISGQISCRRKGETSLWVGDSIPLPPDPQP